MKHKKHYALLCAALFACTIIIAQNPTVVNGVATYHSNKNIGRKFQVPNSWDKIVIKENVTLTGSFYMPTRTKPIEIMGESRTTSIIQGDGSRPTDDGIKGRSYSAIRVDKSPDVYIHNLRSYNPMKFHIFGGFGNVKVESCDLIDDRGQHTTDGVHGGNNKTQVIDCYINTHDDALYITECFLVKNCTIVNNNNGAPFQVGWGRDFGEHTCRIENCVVIDTKKTSPYFMGVVGWAGRNGTRPNTMNIEFVNFKRELAPGAVPAAMYQFGRRNKPIENCTINVTGRCDPDDEVAFYVSTSCAFNQDCSTVCTTPGNASLTSTDATCGQSDGSITFSFEDEANRSSIELSIDGGTNYTNVADNSGSYTFNNLSEGTYNCWVRWGNDDCPTDLGNTTIGCVGNLAPTANAGPNQSVTDSDNNGVESVTLDGTASADDGSIASYVWTEGGSQIATGASPVVSLSVGTHTLTLTVTDNDGLTDSDDVTITVAAFVPTPPVANAGSDQTVNDIDENGSEIVTLDGSASSDPDGTITSYVWSEGGSQIATGVSPSVTLAVGTHTITLTVTDNDGATDTDNVTITVNPGCVQCPYAANAVPGTIEAEEYDLGGQGIAYSDNDAANKGNANFRTDEGVDIDLRSGVISIGWCVAGEWAEYTLDVQQSGTYKVFYTFATNANNNPKSFSFDINGSSIGTVNIAGNDPINNVGNSVFERRELGDVTMAAGTNLLRWTAGSNAISFDKVEFELQPQPDVTPPTVPTGLASSAIGETTVTLSWNASTDSESGVAGYRVYQDGSQVADLAGLSATISGLTCETSYSFTVSAYDNAGNESAESGVEPVTTSACPQTGDFIFIGHVASGTRLGASTGAVDTRPSGNSGANVQWEEVASDGGYFYLVNQGTGQKLNAPTNKTMNMVAASTTANTAQWRWVAQGGGEFFLQSRQWNKYFHIAANGTSDISLKWNTNLAGIRWTITAVPKSIEEMILNVKSLSVYPNPASSQITVEIGKLNEQATLEIFTVSGQLILSKELNSRSERVNVESLESGIYFVKVQNGSAIDIESVLIQK